MIRRCLGRPRNQQAVCRRVRKFELIAGEKEKSNDRQLWLEHFSPTFLALTGFAGAVALMASRSIFALTDVVSAPGLAEKARKGALVPRLLYATSGQCKRPNGE